MVEEYKERILFVDDDAFLLRTYRRALSDTLSIDTASNAEKGLGMLETHGPYAVVISDHFMPGLTGVEFLERVRKVSPNSIRIMITGNAELEVAIRSVNEGAVFQFLTKPCSTDMLGRALKRGIEQFRLVNAERELLQHTLSGSINALTDLMAAASPEAFGRSSRARRYVSPVAAGLKIQKAWPLELAAMLSQVGCVVVPREVLHKAYRGDNLTSEQTTIFLSHTETGRDIIRNLPRLESVASAVAYQQKHFDGAGFPKDHRAGHEIPVGARILKCILDYDSLMLVGKEPDEALQEMRTRKGWYDPEILAALTRVAPALFQRRSRRVKLQDLEPGMSLAADVRTVTGVKLLEKGQEVTTSLCLGLRRMRQTGVAIHEPIEVFT